MTIEGLVRRVYDERLVIEAYHMGKTKILIADDHAVVREGTRQILEQEPDLDVVAEAADGEEAVRLAGSSRPDVDIGRSFWILVTIDEYTRECLAMLAAWHITSGDVIEQAV
ncbi:Protein-glutamate methylesterase/protein-glutamine glutaminase [subsurface metagenome]